MGQNIYAALIKKAAGCENPFDFARVLELLAGFAKAEGCVIWEKFYGGTDERRYFKLADHFPHEDGEPVWHFLPRKGATGDAIENTRIERVNSVAQAAKSDRICGGDLLQRRGVASFCAIPVTFGYRREASVNFYWKKENGPDQADMDAISEVAGVVPELMHSVLNQVGFTLLQTIESQLNNAEFSVPGAGLKAQLDRVVESVAKSFNARECALILEDPDFQGEYKIQATNWPWTFDKKPAYSASDEGLTPWVIREGKTLRFVDLLHFEEERAARGDELAGLTWPTQKQLLEEVLPWRDAASTGPEISPPLSFLCVPIKDGPRTVGAIRCCVTFRAPFLFDERHIQILELVAEQIGHWWSGRMTIRAEQAETRRFRELVTGISAMHDIVTKSLTDRTKPRMDALWQRSLDLLAVVSPWPEALSIRVVEAGGLRYAAHHGARWGVGGHRAREERLKMTYPLDDDWAGGVRAVKEQRVLKETEPNRPGGLRSLLFPETRRILHAPILSGKEAVGVIDVRGFDDRAFPPHLDLLCELIGRQLGLYHTLQETFWQLKSRETELFKQQEVQHQTYEDFVHQLRNPLIKAGLLAERLANRSLPELNQIRTHLRHAILFADTINYFVSLANHDKVTAELDVMRYDEVVPMLVQMADDQETALTDKGRIRFSVDRDSFEALRRTTIYYSEYLLLHCVFNLLDNAAKYSKPDSEVVIRAGTNEAQGRFSISVINQISPGGHRIEASDRKRFVRRGERGKKAMVTTATGRGIGLWIVQKFMDAMGGDLWIGPTDSRDRNTFSLMFKKGIPNAGKAGQG